MKEEDIPDYNVFMMCNALNPAANAPLHQDYHFRKCRPDELEIWKAFPFDSPTLPQEYAAFMNNFVQEVYGKDMDTFYQNTLLVCDKDDTPIATCSHWKAYGKFNTIHWLKTHKSHEGKGIGRALLTAIMAQFEDADYPIYIHTQPGSFRAIKLYADFGFQLLSGGGRLGTRTNDLEICLPILQTWIPPTDFARIPITATPPHLIEMMQGETTIEF